MSGAGETLQAAAIEALRAVAGLSGVYPGTPVQASAPYAIVDAGLETDWSCKDAVGREVRLAVTIRDEGERPARLQALVGGAEEALRGVTAELGPWRLVSFLFMRSRSVREPKGGWTAVIEYRARMLSSAPES